MPTYPPAPDTAASYSILRLGTSEPETATDLIAIEEPLEIQLGYERHDLRVNKTVAITMRTPGHDRELAAGFLFTEGILHHASDIENISADHTRPHTITVNLRSGVTVDLRSLERNNYTTSSCGVCGKTSLDAVRAASHFPLPGPVALFDVSRIHRLPDALRKTQHGFDQTGALHAAALFSADGRLLEIHEDVGRHNAVDKVIGAQFLAGKIPLADRLLFVSSRASFELVQKTLMAGCPALAAVGAPTSLAIELARETGATLLGFVRDRRFNVYAGAPRLRLTGDLAPASAELHSAAPAVHAANFTQ